MLYDQDMPRFQWEEACSTKVYIQNKVPYKALGNMTPDYLKIEKEERFYCVDNYL